MAHLELPKAQWTDAAHVEEMESLYVPLALTPLYIRAAGHGCNQMCRMDKYGFPQIGAKGARRVNGFKTGDIVMAWVPVGKHPRSYRGRVAVRSNGSFNITKADGSIVQGISYRYCRLDYWSDGYSYLQKGGAATSTR